MNELIFAISFAILVTIFMKRHKIVDYLSYNFDIRIGSEIIVYILTFLFVALILSGMLLDNTKEKYSKISQGYQNLKPKEDSRPHKYFDVNTYD
jgi:cytochrome b subunit of formate dehydrogenase